MLWAFCLLSLVNILLIPQSQFLLLGLLSSHHICSSHPDEVGNRTARFGGSSRAYTGSLYCFQLRGSAACLTRRPAWCLIMYLDRVITGRLAKAAPLQAESLQQEENWFHGCSPPADPGAHCICACLFRWLSVLLVCCCQRAQRKIYPPISLFHKTHSKRNT